MKKGAEDGGREAGDRSADNHFSQQGRWGECEYEGWFEGSEERGGKRLLAGVGTR